MSIYRQDAGRTYPTWEYLVEYVEYYDELQNKLDARGSDGWELVAFNRSTLIFKRLT